MLGSNPPAINRAVRRGTFSLSVRGKSIFLGCSFCSVATWPVTTDPVAAAKVFGFCDCALTIATFPAHPRCTPMAPKIPGVWGQRHHIAGGMGDNPGKLRRGAKKWSCSSFSSAIPTRGGAGPE